MGPMLRRNDRLDVHRCGFPLPAGGCARVLCACPIPCHAVAPRDPRVLSSIKYSDNPSRDRAILTNTLLVKVTGEFAREPYDNVQIAVIAGEVLDSLRDRDYLPAVASITCLKQVRILILR
jgi:hypothetical protein